MTNAFSPRPVTGRIKRSKAPGEGEFNVLFQLLPGPALLLDQNSIVVQANSPFLKLTTFSLIEVAGREIHALVSGLPEHTLSMDETVGVLLDRRNRPPLPMNMQVRLLDPNGQWTALLFEPQEDPVRKMVVRMQNVTQTLREVNQIPEDDTIRQAMNRSVRAVWKLLEVTSAAIYRIGGEESEPAIWKSAEAGEAGLLPDIIPSADMLRLSQTYVWVPGRRVQTDLHRAARVQNLAYVASTPLNQQALLVIADRSREPHENLAIGFEAVAAQIGNMLDHLSRLIELRRMTQENQQDLVIWRGVGDNAQEGILLAALDLNVTGINTAAEWMLGYADWEVKGQPVENILIGPDGLLPALEAACEGIPTHNMGSVSLHKRNGQAFPAHIQIIPIQREEQTLAIAIYISDVSEYEENRSRSQQLEQRAVLGEVTAVFAHEVRNPINNISTGLQLLSVKLPENDPSQEIITRLVNDCQRLNHLMESVLNFSRHAEHKLEKLDIDIFLRRLLDRWRPRMARVNVTSYFQIEPDTPPVLADPRSLDQVFTNLVSNAVEAMSAAAESASPGAEKTLAVRVAPYNQPGGRPQVEITVSDNGPGIPDSIRDRIFEPFVTTKQQGTGLGLAITKRIVTAHHGSITVNSFPGGTVFRVLLLAYEGESE